MPDDGALAVEAGNNIGTLVVEARKNDGGRAVKAGTDDGALICPLPLARPRDAGGSRPWISPFSVASSLVSASAAARSGAPFRRRRS